MKRIAIVLALCQAGLSALAQSDAPRLPPSHRAGASSFVCGGVGTDEQGAMKAAASQHDMMLTFATSNGAYLSDVDVKISDSHGAVVLSAKCGGPIMLVDLPAGTGWHVTATSPDGQVRQKTLGPTGGGHLAQATFVWPAS